MSQASQEYTQANSTAYARLAEDFVAAVNSCPDAIPANAELTAARQNYFKTALLRGADFLDINLEELAKKSAGDLADAAKDIPDKLSEQSRIIFEEAAERRTETARWDDFFPDEANEVYRELTVGAKTVDEKIDGYIAKHNAAAPENALQNLGKAIDRKQIRRDPSDQKRLQVYNQNKNVWDPGQNLGRFLEEHYEWGLLDDFQLENSLQRQIAEQTGKYASLKEFVERGEPVKNYGKISADVYDLNSLMVVISRDPQKIGEMSSGQHWSSCMTEGEERFRFVPEDIEAGSLIAYVVSKDDPQARYPLMRHLLKPHRNENGETILVPSKVYGGGSGGNSRTREAFKNAVNNFTATANDGKRGEFYIDGRLYKDDLTGTAVIGTEWSDATIERGMMVLHDNLIQEWSEKLHGYEMSIEGHRQQNGATSGDEITKLEKQAKSLRNTITSLQNPEELARRFFRQTRKESLDSPPDPKACLKIAGSEKLLTRHRSIGEAVKQNDIKPLESYLKSLHPFERIKYLSLIAPIAPLELANQLANAIMDNSPAVESAKERVDTNTLAGKWANPGSETRQRAAEMIFADAHNLSSGRREAFQTVQEFISKESPLYEQATSALETEKKIRGLCYGIGPEIKSEVDARALLQDINSLPTPQLRAFAAHELGASYQIDGSLLGSGVADIICDNVASVKDLHARINCYEVATKYVLPGSPRGAELAKWIDADVSSLPTATERLASYAKMHLYAPKGSEPVQQIAYGVLRDVENKNNELTGKDRIDALSRKFELDADMKHRMASIYYNYGDDRSFPTEDRAGNFSIASILAKPNSELEALSAERCCKIIAQHGTKELRLDLAQMYKEFLLDEFLKGNPDQNPLMVKKLDEIISRGGEHVVSVEEKHGVSPDRQSAINKDTSISSDPLQELELTKPTTETLKPIEVSGNDRGGENPIPNEMGVEHAKVETEASPHAPSGRRNNYRELTRTAESTAAHGVGAAGIAVNAGHAALALEQGHLAEAAHYTGRAAMDTAFTLGPKVAQALETVESASRILGTTVKATGAVLKRAPLIGAVLTAGTVAYEVGEHALNGEWGKAAVAGVAGGAEIAGNVVGFGVGDAGREAVRSGAIATLGEEYSDINKSGLRTLGESAVDLVKQTMRKDSQHEPLTKNGEEKTTLNQPQKPTPHTIPKGFTP